MKIKRLKAKLSILIETSGVFLDSETSSDFQTIMEEEETHINDSDHEESFKSVFWIQQKEALIREGSSGSKKGMRWHPLMIRWCLYLKHQSSKVMKPLDNLRVYIFLPAYFTQLLTCCNGWAWIYR